MKQPNKWIVVVGKPNMRLWNDRQYKPDMSNVGEQVPYSTVSTRQEARQEARRCCQISPWWKYHAKKEDSLT